MIYKTTILISTLGLLASCAFHSGTITSASIDKPVVYKDISVGISTTNKVFGWGGLSKDALVFEAKKQMMLNRKLTADERYGDISIDFKRTFYLVGQKTKVTVIADVIVNKDSLAQENFSAIYKQKMFGVGIQGATFDEAVNLDSLRSSNLFVVGDSVYYNYYKAKQGIFLQSDQLVKCTVQIKEEDGSSKVKNCKLTSIYVMRDSWRGVKKGDAWEKGEVVAFGLDGLLFLRGGVLHFSKYRN